MTCDRVLVALEAINLNHIVHILAFYRRFRVRRAAEKLLEVIFVDKVTCDQESQELHFTRLTSDAYRCRGFLGFHQ